MRELIADTYMAKVEFHLEFFSSFSLRQVMLLQLRRELTGAARLSGEEDLMLFLEPELPNDPYARKLFQKPGPPFVIDVSGCDEKYVDAGDQLILPVIFFGNLGVNISMFARLLQLVGSKGLFKGEGRFELNMIVARDQAGNQQMLWRGGPLPPLFTAPMVNLLWTIEDRKPDSDGVTMTFLTPARLMSGSKPLFNPCFGDIFPFVLRRVTAMFYFWSGVELINDPSDVLRTAQTLSVDFHALKWQDWRHLDCEAGQLNLGGLVGELTITSLLPDAVWDILRLGELLHIGKGAAYGAGQYRLSAHS